MKLNRNVLIFYFLFIAPLLSHAQGFDYMLSLPLVQEKGFHKIIITPEISTKCQSDLKDLRLFDADKKEVPYLLRKELMFKHHQHFVPYEVLSNNIVGDTATVVLVKNQYDTKINNLSIFLNNAEVTKQVLISGSYNQKEWYAVKQNYNLSGIANPQHVTELNTIYFPLSDYSYYKIVINDKNSLPVKLLKVGYYQDSTSYGEETLLEQVTINRTENEAEHLSIFRLQCNASYAIDRVALNITAPTLYSRRTRVYRTISGNNRNNKELIQETTLHAGLNNEILLDQVQAKELVIEIENENNPLLQIADIKCYQRSQYLIAYLEKKGSYILKFGSDTLEAPVYDLDNFEHRIPSQIPVIETAGLALIKDPERPVTETIRPAFYNKKVFLWTAIIAVMLLLLLISGKMLNEMNKKGKS